MSPVRIAIASDHGGLRLKAELKELLAKSGTPAVDLGAHDAASVDYPDYAHELASALVGGKFDLGILVCGSGVGMSISANRHKGVRAVVCSDVYTAKMSRSHNDANVLCLGERVVGPGLAWEIVSTFLAEPASTDERHARRRQKIEPG
ncbi:ribose 5-phosphate isomerase B [Labilithrix luteola]|uniref:ribose 5-phosphate isomerase B n=1 Tax=Labilithrix luteola TaxID=1391654 RepID=UPI001F0B047A|nr:ribose 5-phosphate isomerase B [Labilithrix luteola]